MTQDATVWATIVSPEGVVSGHELVLSAGTTDASIPLVVEGDEDFGLGPRTFTLILKALTNATTGRFVGYLPVNEDDPAPTLDFTADAPRVAEGGPLRFTAALIPAGSTTATLETPTVADDLAEGPATLEVAVEAPEDPLLPQPIRLAGTVSGRSVPRSPG